MKINLLLSHDHRNAFNNHWIVNVLHDLFNVIFIEDQPKFDKSNTIIMLAQDSSQWAEEFYDQGYKIVTEHLWNSGPVTPVEGSLLLTNVNWFWYSESLYYQSISQQTYVPNKNYKKLALMPMWHRRAWRDLLITNLSDLLDDMIYSYAIDSIFLPNDDMFSSSRYNHFNPSWYDDTYFSIVAETRIDSEYFFISEKTYKPLAFYHPFVLVGAPRTLAHLKTNGFETYENLFDESYDNELNFDLRFSKIINNVRNYNKIPYDSLTQDKLAHNHDLFFNHQVIKHRMLEEIIHPMIEWFETKQ
jgi:hypothetical protein